MIVGVKPFGHFRCRRRFASGARPRPIRNRVSISTEPSLFDDVAEHYPAADWLSVHDRTSKIAHRQQVDTRLLLLIPVTARNSRPTANSSSRVEFPAQYSLALFSARDAGQREGNRGCVKNCHYMPLMEFLVFSRPDVTHP